MKSSKTDLKPFDALGELDCYLGRLFPGISLQHHFEIWAVCDENVTLYQELNSLLFNFLVPVNTADAFVILDNFNVEITFFVNNDETNGKVKSGSPRC